MTTRRAFLRSLLQMSDAQTETAQLDNAYWLYGHKDGEQEGKRFRPSLLRTITRPTVTANTRPPSLFHGYQSPAVFISTTSTPVMSRTFNVTYPGTYLVMAEFYGHVSITIPHSNGIYTHFFKVTWNGISWGNRKVAAVAFGTNNSGTFEGNSSRASFMHWINITSAGSYTIGLESWYDLSGGAVNNAAITEATIMLIEIPPVVTSVTAS